MTDSIPLTPEQIASLDSTSSDFLRMTPAQERFLKSVGPGEVCTFYGTEILKVSQERLTAAMETGFKGAATAPAEALLKAGFESSIEFDYEPLALGQTWIRVTAKNSEGKQATAGCARRVPSHAI